MFTPDVYDSKSARFKRPFGAVSAKTPVCLTLRPLRAEGFSHGTLFARFEGRADAIVEVPMPWTDCEGSRDAFSATLETGDYVGLIWYTFRLVGLDERTLESAEYQLTVYDGTDQTPAWFGAGATYQILPDRFYAPARHSAQGLIGGRTLHKQWDEAPEYRPDAHGEIRNRDFFGGDLPGIMAKLPYLQQLGVETLYLCPIFEAAENHRYGTGDYEKIDPMLGTNQDFTALCDAAHALGMHVLLDGVFNHTGFVSKYFNGDGSYPGPGAAQGPESPYYQWFTFQKWPQKYESWWGIYSLPAVKESEKTYVDYIIQDENSIVRRWLRAGADGWRLDVADELPDDFIAKLHAAVAAEKPEGVVIGEVWEDGSTKIAYGVRRQHLLGGHCHGLMNYPFRSALLDYLLGGDAGAFQAEMETLRENYPPAAYYAAMNALGTHDTPRILTLLGVGDDGKRHSRDWRAHYRMSEEERARARARLRLGTLVLFAFPGSPTVYYGDEAGMEGFEDPFNRRTFPWGEEDSGLTAWFAALGQARKALAPLRRGDIGYLCAQGPLLAFTRTAGCERVLCAVNNGDAPQALTLPWRGDGVDVLTGAHLGHALTLAPMEGVLVKSSATVGGQTHCATRAATAS